MFCENESSLALPFFMHEVQGWPSSTLAAHALAADGQLPLAPVNLALVALAPVALAPVALAPVAINPKGIPNENK